MTEEQIKTSYDLAFKSVGLCSSCGDRPECDDCAEKVLIFIDGYRACLRDDPLIGGKMNKKDPTVFIFCFVGMALIFFGSHLASWMGWL